MMPALLRVLLTMAGVNTALLPVLLAMAGVIMRLKTRPWLQAPGHEEIICPHIKTSAYPGPGKVWLYREGANLARAEGQRDLARKKLQQQLSSIFYKLQPDNSLYGQELL